MRVWWEYYCSANLLNFSITKSPPFFCLIRSMRAPCLSIFVFYFFFFPHLFDSLSSFSPWKLREERCWCNRNYLQYILWIFTIQLVTRECFKFQASWNFKLFWAFYGNLLNYFSKVLYGPSKNFLTKTCLLLLSFLAASFNTLYCLSSCN